MNTSIDSFKFDQEILNSLFALTAYPLYEYAPDERTLRAVIIGSGKTAWRMLLDLSWAGQMLDRELYLHAVLPTEEASMQHKERLLQTAPMLKMLSNLHSEDTACAQEDLPYVRYDFSAIGIDQVHQLADCRYFVVDMERAEETADAVRILMQTCGSIQKKVIILHTASEAIPAEENIQCVSIAADSPIRWEVLGALKQKAYLVDYFYTRMKNPFVNKRQTMKEFDCKQYDNLSSLQAASSTGYKLASLGINPRASTQELLAEYLLRQSEQTTQALIYIEHRRWMLSQVVEGFRSAPMEEFSRHCFIGDGNNRFRAAWTDEHQRKIRIHNCIALSRMGKTLQGTVRADWDETFGTFEAIDASDYDELDKQSLRTHLLARQKTEHYKPQINTLLDKIASTLPSVHRHAFADFKKWYLTAGTAQDFAQIRERFDQMRKIVSDVESLEHLLSAISAKMFETEYTDYKASDKDIINVLMLDACTPKKEHVLIKLPAAHAVENIASALIMDVQRIIFPGMKRNNILCRFFEERGGNVEPVFTDEVDLQRIIEHERRQGRRVVIDATGAEAEAITRAIRISLSDSETGITACNLSTQEMLNVFNFPDALLIYARNHSLTAHEAFMLCGSSDMGDIEESFSVHEMEGIVPVLWDRFYKSDSARKSWKSCVHLLQQHVSNDNKNFCCRRRFEVNDAQGQNHASISYSFDAERFYSAQLYRFFGQMKEHRLISDFFMETAQDGNPRVTVHYPYTLFSQQQMQEIFSSVAAYSAPPRVIGDEDSVKLVQPNSMTCCVPAASINPDIRNTLEMLRSMNMLTIVAHSEQSISAAPSKDVWKITFCSPVMKFLCSQEGNLLEAYSYYQMLSKGGAADALLSVHFRWADDTQGRIDDEDVTNEIDVIATKGFRCAVISCKDTKAKKENIYEVSSIALGLAGRHAIPLLVCREEISPLSKNRHTDKNLRNRAAVMNVVYIGAESIDHMGEIFHALMN